MPVPRAALLAIALAACGSSARDSTTTLAIHVTANGVPVGARVLLFDEATSTPLHIGKIDMYGARQSAAACAFAPGVIGTWDGIVLAYGQGSIAVGAATCGSTPEIPYGRYKVWAWRGVEYERFEGSIDLSPGRGAVALDIALERAWQPHGALAADMHVHAHASNDSTMPDEQRVAGQVAAGIQVIGLSNHNTNGDATAAIRALHLEPVVASIPSNEVTSEAMHVNIYPARGAALPESEVVKATPAQLFAKLRALPGNPIIQINHPRFRYQSLFDTQKWDGVAWPPPFPLEFDAVEVVPGYAAFNAPGDRRLDDGLRDFYTLIDHGKLVAPMGGSDTHDFNWVLDGTGRTYVFVADAKTDPKTQPFDEAAYVAAIRARRTVATSGPWLDVSVGGVGPGESVAAHGTVPVDVTVAQTRWMKVDTLTITVGGLPPQVIAVPAGQRAFHWHGDVPIGERDTFVGVSAEGDTALPLELTGTYQRDRWQHAGVTPFAVASPVLIDADGDGRWQRGDGDYLLTPLGKSSQ